MKRNQFVVRKCKVVMFHSVIKLFGWNIIELSLEQYASWKHIALLSNDEELYYWFCCALCRWIICIELVMFILCYCETDVPLQVNQCLLKQYTGGPIAFSMLMCCLDYYDIVLYDNASDCACFIWFLPWTCLLGQFFKWIYVLKTGLC